jgi:hypothetical protein
MQFYKATYSFDKLPFLEKAEFANIHADKIDGHPVFTDPPYTKLQIKAKATALLNAHQAWEANHGDTEYAALLATSGELSGSLKKNANYVTTEANGSKTLIEEAGFVPTKDHVAPSTEKYSVNDTGTSGEVELHCELEDKDAAIVWLYYKGKVPPATIDDYKFLTASSASTILWSQGMDVGSYYCFIAGRVKTKNKGVVKFLAPIVKLVE